LPTYYLLDCSIGRSKQALGFDYKEMQVYICLKKMILVPMYICFKGVETHADVDVSKFMPAIINELQTGVDETWLINKDLDNLT